MTVSIFDTIRHINEFGIEYWSARELSTVLDYSDIRRLFDIVENAKIACKNSGFLVSDHFGKAAIMVDIGSGARREVTDTHLSRYACYLVVQTADSTKPIVSKAKTYFALQTHRQETHDKLVADSMRVHLREEMKAHNKRLAGAAKEAGVTNYANFQDLGYMGLYGNLRQKEIKKKKKLTDKQVLLDHMDSEELAANLFRATQAGAKLKRDSIHGQHAAAMAHYNVGKKVRATIKDLGGTMPEELPAVEHVKEPKKRLKQIIVKKKIK